MSKLSSSHAYGIGIITIIVGVSAGIAYYQMFYIPESTAKPTVAAEILEPKEERTIEIIPGASNSNQQDNFVPKLVNAQLSFDNKVIWKNTDNVAHTVTPDTPIVDSYSGKFGSPGVIKPGTTYEFLFTEDVKFGYHCEPHPWMKGSIEVTKLRI